MLATCAAVALAVAACGGSATANPGAATDQHSGAPAAGAVAVVTSTNVWGDVVKQIGGDRVEVVTLISDPAMDPHSYEATPQNQLAVSKAALIVENGGGYDDFLDALLKGANSASTVINAVDVAGKTAPAGEQPNEHVWYDLRSVGKVAEEIAVALTSADPAGKAAFTANLASFQAQLAGLEQQVGAIKAAHGGAPVATTEPVPLYLLQAAGLRNLTPAAFSDAVEEGTDVPAAVLLQTLKLFSDRSVNALVYNAQTTGPETERVLAAARQNGIPAVPVTETLPDHSDYVSWMAATVAALNKALGG